MQTQEKTALQKVEAQSAMRRLREAKAAQAASMSVQLEKVAAEKAFETHAMQTKLNKMRMLQEKALGGVAGSTSRSHGRLGGGAAVESTRESALVDRKRARGLLYWETLKLKAHQMERPTASAARR